MIHQSQRDRAALTADVTGLVPVAIAAVDLINLSNLIGMTRIRRFNPELAAAIERVEDAARGVG